MSELSTSHIDRIIELERERDDARVSLAETRAALADTMMQLRLSQAGLPGLGVVEFDSEQTSQLRERIAKLQAAGDLLYLQALDANGWINLGATWPGAGLCICYDCKAGREKYDPEILETMTEAPTEHDIVCTPFRAALAAWKAARPDDNSSTQHIGICLLTRGE